ncbi:hypothetical protein [Aliiroseovarius lamellibrachiae]|uniref:hypothetical protein n=1 Tax=Aliiroseovarius lamellibrachiae TaxID=1924933 RepID=UPI001BDFF2FD|nr:hypothetical protein [Aliiroseovarius lamellibrachiae]MBT2130959.1 hypothetical protein [Aliiroseovarius lamellibrachiae]
MKNSSVFHASIGILIMAPIVAVMNCVLGAGGTLFREGECLINVFPLYEAAAFVMGLALITAFGGASITLAAILVYLLFVWIVAKLVSVVYRRWSSKVKVRKG